MKLEVNDKIHGFTVTRLRDIEEFEGRLVEMEHDRTGAGLIWAESSEENKLFSVGFRTLPEDNTGVFHILEHSVLCGSENYPVKEPFVELLKTSMNTFLNAMTYSDKTLYPVSSRMEQDYLNLTRVYLDAVFRPNILSQPNIFYQEGWHIEYGNDGEAPSYKGVVFNEMKGAMSDVDQIAERELMKLLFPDTCYGFNSGGDPESIPDLTYDDFIARYKKYYHPSNSYFYLDGDIPLEKTLSLIDSYISGYDRLEDVPEIGLQTPCVSNKELRYEVGNEGGKPMIVYGRIAGTWEERDKLLALNVLIEQLADSNESPLKRAVLSTGLAEDMEIYISDCVEQLYLVLLFRGITPESCGDDTEESIRRAGDKLLETVREVAEKMIAEGIPERDLEASLNQLDFRSRQNPEPQGLYRANAVLNSWLYGGDPALFLKTNEAISNLRAMISDDIITDLLKEYMLDTDSLSRLILLPSDTLGNEKAAAEAKRVSDIVNAMDESELTGLRKLNEDLFRWQETPDSEEALQTIPKLDLKDIKREPELIGTHVTEKDGVTILYHPVTTNGIIYINAFFPITDLSLEQLPAAALLTEFYKDLPTENYSVTELQTELRMYVGSMSFGIDINSRDSDNSCCTPCLRGRVSVLRENLSHAEDLLIEIMTRTQFSDRSLMKELITQIDEEGRRYAVSSGHRLAIYAARSHYSARDAAAEAVNGCTFLQYMHEMNAEFETRIDDFVSFAEDLISRSVIKAGSYLSVTASEEADMDRFISMLPDGTARPDSASYTSCLPVRLGIRVPASVSHSVAAYDLRQIGTRAAGSMSVAANMLSLSYLWNEVRVKGGAYGASVNANRTGSYFCYSYRDPSPARTLSIYAGAPDYLDAVASAGDMDLSGLIISAIALTEPLISPASKGRAADDFWFSGFTDEDRIRVRREILDTTPADLLGWKEAFRALAEDGSVCVIGPESALEACEDLETVSI